MRGTARKYKWLGWAAGVLAGLFVLGVAAGTLAGYAAHLGPVFSRLNELAWRANESSVTGIQDMLADQLQACPRIVALLAADPDGLIVAADPRGATGMRLPLADRYPRYPGGPPFSELRLWVGRSPTAVAQALGVSGEPGSLQVAGRPVWDREGKEVGYLWAVVETPRFLGVTASDWDQVLPLFNLLAFVLAVLALGGWVWQDARRREMDAPLAWGLLALVTNAIGWATYLVARGWRRPLCPTCKKAIRPAYRACPYCGTQVSSACPKCGGAVREGWSFCPHCAAALG